MTRYLTTAQVLAIYEQVMQRSGGAIGIRYVGGVHAAVAQPQATFDGQDLYPTLAEKAAALAYTLIQNHPFLDGNKRIGHAAMEIFLILNGYEIQASVDEQETIILSVAASQLSREEFTTWVRNHLQPRA